MCVSYVSTRALIYSRKNISSTSGLQPVELIVSVIGICLCGFRKTFQIATPTFFPFLTKFGTHDVCASMPKNCRTFS